MLVEIGKDEAHHGRFEQVGHGRGSADLDILTGIADAAKRFVIK